MINKNKKRLFKLLMSMLGLSGIVNVNAMEERHSYKKLVETVNFNVGENVVSLIEAAKEVCNSASIDNTEKLKFALTVLKKLYRSVSRSAEEFGSFNLYMTPNNIFLKVDNNQEKNLLTKYSNFKIVYGNVFLEPIAKEINSEFEKKYGNKPEYFLWKHQHVIKRIQIIALSIFPLDIFDSLEKIVFSHCTKEARSSEIVISGSWTDICYKPFKPENIERNEKELAQSYDDLINYCDEELKKLG